MSSTTTQTENERWLAGLLGGDFLPSSPNIQAERYLRWEQIFTTRKVPASDPIPLMAAPEPIDPVCAYGGQRRTVEELMKVDYLGGLLVLQDGEVALERYGLGLEPGRTWQSSLMVKSLASVLVGVAIHDGYIDSLDDLVIDHVPELKVNPSYEGVTLRHLLQRSAGTKFSEEYDDHESDVMEHYLRPIAHRRPGVILEQREVSERQYESGEHVHYNTGDSFLLSLILSRAVGRTVSECCAERVWKPMGMEDDGYFMLDSDDGDAIHQFPAQLGVCWVAWMIVWPNAFGNKPTNFGEPVNLVIRGLVTFGLVAATFVAYYLLAAEHVLHERQVVRSIARNALGFMNWFALVALLYIVGFESFGLPRPADPAAAPATQH